MTQESERPASGRRGFITGFLALLAGILPPLSGLGILLDPLRRSSDDRLVRITTLDALPEDGVPRQFPVVTGQIDAWNRRDRVPVGAVYLRRTGSSEVQAFSVSCPHAGCHVEYRRKEGDFLCPCHNSSFAIDGTIQGPSPSLRPLDTLEVDSERMENEGEIWIRFRKFRAGTRDKVSL